MKKIILLTLLVSTVVFAAPKNAPKNADEEAAPAMTEMKDPRDDRVYKTVTIDGKVWMAENLKFVAPLSFCYEDRPTLCKTYGRMYPWISAMNIDEKFKSESFGKKLKKNHQGICPTSWHLPTSEEWESLAKAVGAVKDTCNEAGLCSWKGAAKPLMAVKGWETAAGEEVEGTDSIGFNAVAGGSRDMLSTYENKGALGMFWSVDEVEGDALNAYRWVIGNDYLYFDSAYKSDAYSVRCVRNY